jgi:hypothetical protein
MQNKQTKKHVKQKNKRKKKEYLPIFFANG